MSSEIYNLIASRRSLSPAETFHELVTDCSELGIDRFDVYGDYDMNASTSWLRRFEDEVAQFCGKEGALFLPSGCMAQAIVLKHAMKCSDSSGFICHYSSHILLHEHNAYSALLDMTPTVVQYNAEEVVQQPIRSSDVLHLLESSPKPSVMIVECPHREIGGKCTTLDDLRSISKACRGAGVHLHMDGARFWEAQAYYEEYCSIHELCSLFDSMYVSFYKGLGAVTGSMLLAKGSLISEYRIWMRRFGGNLFTQLPMAVSCYSGFRKHSKSFTKRRDRLREIVKILSNAFITGKDMPKIRFDPEIPEVSLVHLYINSPVSVCKEVRDSVLVETKISCFNTVRQSAFDPSNWSYFEFNLGPGNYAISNDVWLEGWTKFLEKV